jgi:hypothetical protein
MCRGYLEYSTRRSWPAGQALGALNPPSCFCRADAGAFVGGRLFVMGGWRRPDLTYTGLADVESYDPNSNMWCPSKPHTSLNPKPQTLSSR